MTGEIRRLIDEQVELTSERFSGFLSGGLPDFSMSGSGVISTWAARCGVTRIAETTNLDRVGIPTAYAVRPAALHPSAIVASGRGTTQSQALRSALFEAHERWAAEESAVAPLSVKRDVLERHFPRVKCVSAYRASEQYADWLIGYDLIARKPCFVPVEFVLFPYMGRRRLNFRTSTSGLASGSTPASAICAGILELFERDALSRFSPTTNDRLDPLKLPLQAAELYAKYHRCNIDLSLWRCVSPTEVPVFYCLSRDDEMRNSVFFCSGSAAHTEAETALVRTLTEVAQSRAGFITGLREDVGQRVEKYADHSYSSRRTKLATWFEKPYSLLDFSHSSTGVTSGAHLETLLHAFGTTYRDEPLVCVELRQYPALSAFRIFSPALNEPDQE